MASNNNNEVALKHCPRCDAPTDQRVLAKSKELYGPVVRLAQQALPGWQSTDGLCPFCAQQLADQLSAQRSTQSLHTFTNPATTFPYYHPAEERVLSQPERLLDYHTFTGRGVTIAFLDSGFYPHPDLAVSPHWPDDPPPWPQLDAQQLRTMLSAVDLRLAHYVDLTDGTHAEGLQLASLWDGAGTSWHGQMTTTLAAGNGLLSDGLYRGYAPQAQILPIKIGRSSGRIPEEDILAGLNWLLEEDRWQQYNVRVVNVAVGGDFDEPWYNNLVCLAAEALSDCGVLICAAAGNSQSPTLYAPAQAPSILTVGGYTDGNRRWQPQNAADVAALDLYYHNYGRVQQQGELVHKPELLAPSRWLPAPFLPTDPSFAEGYTIGQLRRALLENLPPDLDLIEDGFEDIWFPEVWQAVRKRMNILKWSHPFYQHVDGTSVAVAQVSAVAAQLFEANPRLSGAMVKELLLETALPLPTHPSERTGYGVLQPALAVAAALRAGGPLTGYPRSGTQPSASELQKLLRQGKVTPSDVLNATTNEPSQPVYFGIFAPQAQAVNLIGDWQGWQPQSLPLRPTNEGWWHGIVLLPPGQYTYRFWIEPATNAEPIWCPDPENPIRQEGGYQTAHSVLIVEA